MDDAEHVHPFTDMHDLGDGLVRADLAEPVLDVSRYTLTYPEVGALMRDLKAARARTRGRIAALAAAYERFRSDGRLPASYAIVFGQAWSTTETSERGRECAVAVGDIGRREPRAG